MERAVRAPQLCPSMQPRWAPSSSSSRVHGPISDSGSDFISATLLKSLNSFGHIWMDGRFVSLFIPFRLEPTKRGVRSWDCGPRASTELRKFLCMWSVKFVPAVAYHFCLNLPASFSQTRTKKFSQLCTSYSRGLITSRTPNRPKGERAAIASPPPPYFSRHYHSRDSARGK